jgi:cyclopropane-fatty-acyl-phospholipid synthase
MSDGLVAIGESYVAGLWEVNNNKTLDEVIALILNIPMDARQEMYRSWNARLVALAARTFNYASASKGLIVGSASEQFDLGAEFRREYMDKSFHHGFGVWTDGVRTLDDAQDRKLSSLSTKLDLNISTPQPTVRLLDVCVGSWGGVGCFLTARNASTIGQTTCILTSHQELIHAEKSAEELGVKSKMKFIIAENPGKLIFMLSLLERDSFDRVVCCNFLEALQRPQQHAVFQHFRRILKYSGGQVVMDFVTCSAIRTTLHTWNNKYIHGSFGFNPLSLSQVRSLAQVHGFYIEEIVAYTDHYEQTYLAWHRRFKSRWNDIEQSDPLQQVRPRQDESLTLTSRNPSLPESFKRTWEFYLLHSAAAFRARAMQVYQMKLVGQ